MVAVQLLNSVFETVKINTVFKLMVVTVTQ